MKIEMRYGKGKFELVDKRWVNAPVSLDHCLSWHIKNRDWDCGVDSSCLMEDSVDTSPNDRDSLFLNGIYFLALGDEPFFKNVSLEISPLAGKVDVWRCGELEIIVSDGVVKDLDLTPKYGVSSVRNIMADFGYRFCDMNSMKCRYEEECDEGCDKSFEDWLLSKNKYDIMDLDQLGEAEAEGPHWWYIDFMYQEVHEWVYEGVEKWRKEQVERICKLRE